MPWNYQFTMLLPNNFTDEDLQFISQLGVPNVYMWLGAHQHEPKALSQIVSRIADHGLKLHTVLSAAVAKNAEVILNGPHREEAFRKWEDFIPLLAEHGIHNTTFTWEQNAVYSSKRRGTSRGSDTRLVDMQEIKCFPMSHGRAYTSEEVWANYETFIDRVLPVAKKYNVTLQLHPNDPPVRSLGGVATLIHGFEDYKRAFKIADNDPILGMEFCCGCWLEGYEEGFADLLGGLKWCLERGKVQVVHFRNIDRPLPVFVETYLDNGFFEMYPIMKMLHDHDYQGVITLDHTPRMAGDPKGYAAQAYAIGYMRALAERAVAGG